MGFPDPAIGEASARLVQEHQSKYAQTSRILQQVRADGIGETAPPSNNNNNAASGG